MTQTEDYSWPPQGLTRSLTVSTFLLGMMMSGGSQSNSNAEILSALPPPKTSRNPSEVINAVFTPFLSSTALVETVAPCLNERVVSPDRSALFKPFKMSLEPILYDAMIYYAII